MEENNIVQERQAAEAATERQQAAQSSPFEGVEGDDCPAFFKPSPSGRVGVGLPSFGEAEEDGGFGLSFPDALCFTENLCRSADERLKQFRDRPGGTQNDLENKCLDYLCYLLAGAADTASQLSGYLRMRQDARKQEKP